MSSVLPLEKYLTMLEDKASTEEETEESLPDTPAYFSWTGWLNRLAAVILLIPGLPAILILTLLMRISSRGPGIYRQFRVGLRGRTFTVYKIRTMRQDAEAGTGPVWSSGKGDPRVTRLGRVYRALHLDELPQLFNVLSGDMNLIGPRPERPEFTQYLAKAVPGYLGRLAIKPGITGLAQIQLPPDTDLDSVRLKLATDLQYIDSAGLWMDLRILFCTFLRMFGIKGDRVVRLFGFNYGPAGIDLAHRRALKAGHAAPVNGQQQDGLSAHVFSNGNSSNVAAGEIEPRVVAPYVAGSDQRKRVPQS